MRAGCRATIGRMGFWDVVKQYPAVIAAVIGFTAASCYIGALLLPPLGRFISPWRPRFGGALIQLGSDLRGVSWTLGLPPGTPSVEAVHPLEKAAVAAEVTAAAQASQHPPKGSPEDEAAP